MLISVVNRSKKIGDEELQCVIRAINRQIHEDFEPYWSFGAQLRLEGKIGRKADKEKLAELKGDAVIYLWDKVDVANALGYHSSNLRGIPYGFVFTELAAKLGESWTVTLSHEALELLGDAQGNLLVTGPHPEKPALEVFHWFEMCDAVQAQTYKIDNIDVANFVLPLYFTGDEEEGGRDDFLGRLDGPKPLGSFGVAKGGYIGFFNPKSGQHETYAAPDDPQAKKRLEVKRANFYGRGYVRSNRPGSAPRENTHLRALGEQKSVMASASAPDDPIKHVIVLMLENRSFDHMLGGMTKIDKNVDGVRQSGQPYTNKGPNGQSYAQNPNAKWVIAKKRDLDHEHVGTLTEIGAKSSPMSGFVATYLARYPDAAQAELEEVMSYFPFGDQPSKDALPALHGLARNFAVCDRWFSSMPGPTWQNRFFAHSGTSLGHLRMPSKDNPEDMHVYYQDTIFDRLSDAGVTWKVYHDGVPQSIVMTRMLRRWLTHRGYSDMDEFFAAAQGSAADFPEYAFIEPRYFGADENDQHPPADVRNGDRLIADVYNAIRANDELWKSTLLLVTYDEHGAFYDHVYPPATVAPDAFTGEWSFDQLGVRVPTVLVSPWVQRGVIKTVFDHTSLLRYLYEKWNLQPLEARTQPGAGQYQSNTFASELKKLGAARDDTPPSLQVAKPLAAAALAPAAAPPIEGSREALLMFVEQLPQPSAVPAAAGPLLGRVAPGAGAVRGARKTVRSLTAAAAAPTDAARVGGAMDKLESLREVHANAPEPQPQVVKPKAAKRKPAKKKRAR